MYLRFCDARTGVGGSRWTDQKVGGQGRSDFTGSEYIIIFLQWQVLSFHHARDNNKLDYGVTSETVFFNDNVRLG